MHRAGMWLDQAVSHKDLRKVQSRVVRTSVRPVHRKIREFAKRLLVD